MTFLPAPSTTYSKMNLPREDRKPVRNKQNRTNLHWYVVRTQPHQEPVLCDLLSQAVRDNVPNILEVYCPLRTTVHLADRDRSKDKPLYSGHVFVLGTHQAISDFLVSQYPQGKVLYRRTQEYRPAGEPWVVPDEQMRAFREFNENYADQLIILERPFTDYAFNPKTSEPNEVIRVIDGPLAGREGYLTRFRGSRRLVFNMPNPFGPGEFTASIPEVWNFHVVRLHNADADRLSLATSKARALDHLHGLLQGCGYADDQCQAMLTRITDALLAKPSITSLCRQLAYGHHALADALRQMEPDQARGLMYLIRCMRQERDYVHDHYPRLSLRPFLTPTSGIACLPGKDYALLQHPGFTECIISQSFTEQTYYPRMGESRAVPVHYYAHVGIMRAAGAGTWTVFANWHQFLDEYFHTADAANLRLVSGTTITHREVSEKGEVSTERQLESFRNYAPSLYRILTDASSPVHAARALPVAGTSLCGLCATVPGAEHPDEASPMDIESVAQAVRMLVSTCLQVCREINTTTHLAIWRRLLATVWLHE